MNLVQIYELIQSEYELPWIQYSRNSFIGHLTYFVLFYSMVWLLTDGGLSGN